MSTSKRIEKGNSLIDFPDSYCVIDIETTGLDPEYDEIIEVGAIKVEDGQVVDEFASLVKPSEPISDFISELTGITNKMLKKAPSAYDILPAFFQFVGKSIVVGHNVNFDINFLYDNNMMLFNKAMDNDFIDTMRISRRLLNDLPHHRLRDLVDYYELSDIGAHRVLSDCMQTHYALCKLRNDAVAKFGTVEEFKNSCKPVKYHSVKAADITASAETFNPDHPLYGKTCVFTGVLDKMVRKEAMQLVADVGGIIGDSVTKKTNYLILGNNDYCKAIKDGKSNKQKKAEKLILEGADLQIITENVFYDMFEL